MKKKETNGNISDESLLLSARKGDGSATEELLVRYKPLVRKKAAARYLLGGDRDDLLQEGMIGLYKAIRRYETAHESGASFSTYASTCIERQILHAIESTQRQKNRLLNESLPISEDAEEMSGQEKSPEQIVLDHEGTDELLANICAALSPMEQEVLHLFLEGYDYREIAQRLRKEAKSIDNALQRIRRKARQVRMDS